MELSSVFIWLFSLVLTAFHGITATRDCYPEHLVQSYYPPPPKKMQIKGLYKKRGWYYYQGPQKDGVRPPAIALKTQDEDAAIDEAYKRYSEGPAEGASAMNASGEDPRMLVRLDEWLGDALAEGVHRPKTSYITKSCLTDLARLWSNPPLSWISRDRILKWRVELLKRPGKGGRTMSEASVTSYLRRLQGFLSWCVRRRYLRKSPMDDIKIPQVKITKRQQFCTMEDRDRLLEKPPSDEIEFILLFGFYAGLRFGEMLAMDQSWITTVGEKMFVSVQVGDNFKPKDGELRTIKLHSKITTFLERYGMRSPYLLKADRSEWVELPAYRYNPKKQLKTYVTKMGLPWVTYHTLRHSFASHLALKGAPMIEIASMLGDTLEVTERTYIGFAPGSESVVDEL